MTADRVPTATVCGRAFSESDVEIVRRIICADAQATRAAIARRTCEALAWRTATGELKAMSCRVALLRLQERGLLQLPPARGGNGNRQRYQPQAEIVPPEHDVAGRVQDLCGLEVRAVETRQDSRRWNEAIARFHYLGYRPLPGAQQRYLVEHDAGLLGVVGFAAAAWKVAARDQWIGWTPEQRKRRLHLVLNNARFLLLPWVRVPHLASWVLSRCARRIAADFARRYGYRPLLLETFVERDRFLGTCYRAANWVDVGETKGRGKLDRFRRHVLPVKRVLLYPLRRGARAELCS